MAARLTLLVPMAVPAMVISCWLLLRAVVGVPAATTAPASVAATPETVSEAALPSAGLCRQLAPSGEMKAVSVRPDRPASTTPAGPPFIRPGVKPAGVVRVAANVHVVPLRDR